MKKIVEIEYVGIEDVQDIIDDAYALIRNGHYVSVDLTCLGGVAHVAVYIMVGGFNNCKDFDYTFNFFVDDKPENLRLMYKCKDVLNNLLAEV